MEGVVENLELIRWALRKKWTYESGVCLLERFGKGVKEVKNKIFCSLAQSRSSIGTKNRNNE